MANCHFRCLLPLLAGSVLIGGLGGRVGALIYRGRHVSMYTSHGAIATSVPDATRLLVPGRFLFLGDQRPEPRYDGNIDVFFTPLSGDCYVPVRHIDYRECPRVNDDMFRSCLNVSSRAAEGMDRVNVDATGHVLLTIDNPRRDDTGVYVLRVGKSGAAQAHYDTFALYVYVYDATLVARLAQAAIADAAGSRNNGTSSPREPAWPTYDAYETYAEAEAEETSSIDRRETGTVSSPNRCYASLPAPAGFAVLTGPPPPLPAWLFPPTSPHLPTAEPGRALSAEPEQGDRRAVVNTVTNPADTASADADASARNGTTPGTRRHFPAPVRIVGFTLCAVALGALLFSWIRCIQRMRAAARRARLLRERPIYTASNFNASDDSAPEKKHSTKKSKKPPPDGDKPPLPPLESAIVAELPPKKGLD